MGCGGSSQQQVEPAEGGRQAEDKAAATATASRPPPVAASAPPAATATQRPAGETKAPPPKPPTPPPPAPPLPPPRDRAGGSGGKSGGGRDSTTQEEPQRKYETAAEEPPPPPPPKTDAAEDAAAAGAPAAEAAVPPAAPASAGKADVRVRLGLDSASVFDTAFAMEQVDGDIDFAVEMAESMVVQYDDVSTSVPEAIEAQEWAAVFEKAHALKGAVATLGVNRVRIVAHALEQAGRVFNDAAAGNGDSAQSAYSVPELAVLLEILAEEWEQYLKVFKQETDSLRSENP